MDFGRNLRSSWENLGEKWYLAKVNRDPVDEIRYQVLKRWILVEKWYLAKVNRDPVDEIWYQVLKRWILVEI